VSKMMCVSALSLLMFGCGVEGIHSANPKTVIRVDPWSKSVYVGNNKDVDLSVDKLSFNKETNDFTVENLVIKDNASGVRDANIGQIQAVSIQTQMITQAIVQSIRELVPILGGYAPKPIWGEGQPGAVPGGDGSWVYIGPGLQATVTPSTKPSE